VINPTTVLLLKIGQMLTARTKQEDRTDLAYLEIPVEQLSEMTFIVSGGECNLTSFNSISLSI
jgi:hypothetical protein